jgi:hypothetical protein
VKLNACSAGRDSIPTTLSLLPGKLFQAREACLSVRHGFELARRGLDRRIVVDTRPRPPFDAKVPAGNGARPKHAALMSGLSITGEQASLVGSYMDAVSKFLAGNDRSILDPFIDRSVTDINGKTHWFETNPNTLYRLSMVVIMITYRQIRAAGALLGWSQQQLADKAIVSLNAVSRLEKGRVDTRSSTLRTIEKALAKAGVEFFAADVKGEGVRVKSPKA